MTLHCCCACRPCSTVVNPAACRNCQAVAHCCRAVPVRKHRALGGSVQDVRAPPVSPEPALPSARVPGPWRRAHWRLAAAAAACPALNLVSPAGVAQEVHGSPSAESCSPAQESLACTARPAPGAARPEAGAAAVPSAGWRPVTGAAPACHGCVLAPHVLRLAGALQQAPACCRLKAEQTQVPLLRLRRGCLACPAAGPARPRGGLEEGLQTRAARAGTLQSCHQRPAP